MYSNNILNFQVYDNFKFLYKKVWKLIECTMYKCLNSSIKKLQTTNILLDELIIEAWCTYLIQIIRAALLTF